MRTILKNIRGNARTCVLAEPLFIVPYSLFTTYASIYMLKLHVSATGLGLVTTINLLLQIVSAFVSGYLTDRMGRLKALWVYDVVSWSFGTLVWAISQNFWWFVLAAVLNSFQRIPSTAWYCLLVEDTPPENRTFVFTGLQIVNVIGGIFAPLGGILVSHFSLVPATRLMYAFACISMSTMIYVRHIGSHETEIGLRKMRERTKVHFGRDFREYVVISKQILGNQKLFLLFLVYVLWNIQTTIRTTFVSVFQVDFLHIPVALISLFPAISSVAMIALLYTVVPKFREEQASFLMNLGFALLGFANLILVFTPSGNFTWVVISTLLAAIGTIVANPYIESVVANAIDDEHRATMLSVLNVMILIFTSPAGIIGGWTYSIHPQIPIYLVTGIFLLSMLLVWWAKHTESNPVTIQPSVSES